MVSVRSLIAEEFVGVCIESSGSVHKLSKIDTPDILYQIAKQEALELVRTTWGKEILERIHISSFQEKRLSSSFSKLEIIVENESGKAEFILVLVFRKSKYKIDEVFQELKKGIDLLVKNPDKWISTILFHKSTQI